MIRRSCSFSHKLSNASKLILTIIPMASRKASSNLLLFVTGASRGLGRAIAEGFSGKNARDTVHFVLFARSATHLDTTRTALLREGHADGSIRLIGQDFSELDTLESQLDSVLDEILLEKKSFDRVIFINNHGHIGHIGPCTTSPSLEEMRKCIDLNLTSCLWTSVRVARFAKEVLQKPCTIVNVSSAAAVAPFPSFGIYCAGKAARNMFHTIMALDDDKLRVLNYAPGPLETEMTEEIRRAPQLDGRVRPHFQKQLVDPVDSAEALVQLLIKNEFENGSHIDYFDLPRGQGDA